MSVKKIYAHSFGVASKYLNGLFFIPDSDISRCPNIAQCENSLTLAQKKMGDNCKLSLCFLSLCHINNESLFLGNNCPEVASFPSLHINTSTSVQHLAVVLLV